MEYNKIAELLLTQEQYLTIKDTVLDYDSLYDLLVEEQEYLLFLDWTGESDENQLYHFLVERLALLGQTINLDTASIYKVMYSEFDKGNLKRGEAVTYLVNAYKQYLPQDYVIIEVNTQSDFYLLGITHIDTATALAEIHTDFGNITQFSTRNENEVLYIITCKCGMDNIWQLPANETAPDEGECDSCGTELFDDKRKPYFPMIIENV
ncbi:hypothetical protein HX049_04435 [Myroides odoratimimus]|uniref:DUF6630 family protein n=1 Tax=Myroides odoratimimus TaxID=76832 RepID=UPI002579004C|nr:hypothetical protein [Myroides odoratimimus]MDM1396425.1 hypothetical protein [Myroides odoratimimus]